MADVTFYYHSMESSTLSTAIATEANYPLVNLNDRCKDIYWKENGDGAGHIQIDLGSTALTIDKVILGSHNLTSTSHGIKLSYCTDGDGNFTPEFFVVGSAGAYHDYVTGDVTNWLEPFVAQEAAKQYWRLYMEAMGSAKQIGTIFLVDSFAHGVNWSFTGGKLGFEYGIEERRTVSGAKRTQKNHGRRRTWSYRFEWIDETHRTALETFLGVVEGNRYPFFFADEDENLYFVRLKNPDMILDHMVYQQYDFNIELEEEI